MYAKKLKKHKNFLWGRGNQTDVHLVSSSSKSFKNSFFKPVVASSLALLLGSALYGDGSLTTNCGTTNGGNCSPITGNITLQWGSIESDKDFSISDSSGNKTVTFNKTKGSTNIVNFKDSAFQDNKIFADSGNHTMTVDFGNNTGKTFNLDVVKSDFTGNLTIAGSGSNNNFKANFAKNIIGDITIGTSGNLSNINTEFVFDTRLERQISNQDLEKSNIAQELNGDIVIHSKANSSNTFVFKDSIQTQKIWTIAGKSSFVFEKDATIQTNKRDNNKTPETIYTGYYETDTGVASATFIFKGNNNLIKNQNNGIVIQASGNTTNQLVENTINFQGSTNTIEGIIVASANHGNADYTKEAINNITFDANTFTNTIKGKIETLHGPYTSNRIRFNNTIGTNTIEGQITSNAGANNITFSGGKNTIKSGGNNTIKKAETQDTAVINANLGGTNNITFNNGTNVITVNNESASAQNNIAISSNAGTNNIIFNGGTNTIDGNIKAIGGKTAKNNIAFNGGKNTIQGNIIAQRDNVNSKNQNFIAFNGGSSNVISGRVMAGLNSSNGDKNYQQNIITIKNASLTIQPATTMMELQGDEATANILSQKRGMSIINLEGNEAVLSLKKTADSSNNKSDGVIYNKDATSIATINFNAGISKLLGNIKNENGTTNLNIGNNVKATIAGNVEVTAGKLNIEFDNGTSTLEVKGSLGGNGDVNIDVKNANATMKGNVTIASGKLHFNFDGDSTLNIISDPSISAFKSAVPSASAITANLVVKNGANAVINTNLISKSGLKESSVANVPTITNNIIFEGSNSSLSFNNQGLGKSIEIASLDSRGSNNTINLSSHIKWHDTIIPKSEFQTLEIKQLKSSNPLNFIVHVNPTLNNKNPKSDRFIIEDVAMEEKSSESNLHYLGVLANPDDVINKNLYTQGDTTNNIALATVKNSSGITLKATDSVYGFSLVSYDFVTEKTDKNGENGADYTTYFLGSARSNGATLATQLASASALGANYDLYLANLNSLNKRMGELRENANSQGAWVRVFNGMQTSKFALETKSIYTTIQAGYDYAFGFNGANNYLGFAISYANSMSNTKNLTDQNSNGSLVERGIKNINSNAVEFAIYNAYVQDGASKESGWKNGLYTDSILKFSYITSKLDLTGETKTYSTNNYAITFSQEVGYRFLLGKAKEFYIDPQAEISLGYLNQSDLKQELGQSFLNGIQDSIFTLRGRIGSNFGYDFKNFTQDKGFNAKIYLGTYFVGDYISGGDVSLTDKYDVKVSLSPLASTTRFVLNLGTNFKIKDAHRIYFDFERSFGGKIITDYQINLGYRYSFGASNYTPYNLSNTQEIKDTNSIKEIEPTKGYYLELLNKQDLSKKESKLLKDLKDLKVKTNNNTKTYLIGPFENEDAALKQKQALQGLLKELNSEGNVIVIE